MSSVAGKIPSRETCEEKKRDVIAVGTHTTHCYATQSVPNWSTGHMCIYGVVESRPRLTGGSPLCCAREPATRARALRRGGRRFHLSAARMTGCPRASLIHAIALAVVAARQSASSKMASCTPANAQDSSVEQCNPWCKADAEHKIHCTVRGRAQRISTPRCVSLLCVLLYGSSANARPVRSAEAQCRRRPDRRHHHLRRRSAPRRRTAIQICHV